jgi:hypothetical protein
MHFPDGFKLFSDENLPEMDTDEPQPPKEPRGGFPNIGAGLAGMTDPARHIQTPTVTPPGNVSSPNIEATNSYDVDFSVRKLKHILIRQLTRPVALPVSVRKPVPQAKSASWYSPLRDHPRASMPSDPPRDESEVRPIRQPGEAAR